MLPGEKTLKILKTFLLCDTLCFFFFFFLLKTSFNLFEVSLSSGAEYADFKRLCCAFF